MTSSTFNAITYANKLKQAGIEPRGAEAIAEEQSNFINSNVATKSDIALLKSDIAIMEIRLQAFIVKCLISTTGLICGLITLLHFIKSSV